MNQTSEKSRLTTFGTGIAIGVSNAVIFNPWDKANYEMMKNHTKFFNKNNWVHPMYGVKQALAHRIVSYGLYFPLIDFYKACLPIQQKDNLSLVASVLTGTTTGILLNPLIVKKAYNWNIDRSFGSIKLAFEIYKRYGLRVLTRSLGYTVTTNIVFATIYTYINQQYNHADSKNNFVQKFGIDFSAASLATTVYMPLQYMRNQILFTPLNQKPPSLKFVYEKLKRETKEYVHNNKLKNYSYNLWNRFFLSTKFLYINKFCWLPITTRVALGMSLSRVAYNWFTT